MDLKLHPITEPCWDGDEKLAILKDGRILQVRDDGTHFYPLAGGSAISRSSFIGWVSSQDLRKLVTAKAS
ncbi:hypothetical protein [Rhizobium sp. Nf11,1]|uniref:hypothetical protein n=1 Tax=Rhizobium sp. Nf11,1 TaxID=3404923 RepID=UPI003D3427E5